MPDRPAYSATPQEEPSWCRPASSRITQQVAEQARRAERRESTGATRHSGWCCWRRQSACGVSFTPIPNGSFHRVGGDHERIEGYGRQLEGYGLQPVHISSISSGFSPRGKPPKNDPLVVLLLGPTGSGKTALSLALGERFGGEIVSCDSVAVYRGMDLGTAKATPEERARLPHHLIDVADPDKPFTAGEYSRQARAALSDIAARGRLPIVTGGTGLYLCALTEGLFAGPERQHGIARED